VPDGSINTRNVDSAHWKYWLDPERRCRVPFTSFSEYDTIGSQKVPVWFAQDGSKRPLPDSVIVAIGEKEDPTANSPSDISGMRTNFAARFADSVALQRSLATG
jgi:putative SOS response-associated peptidase YedK